MSYSDAALLRQLSSNSTPYRDPLGVIEWGQLNLDDPWLPEPALSLYGLPEYETLSDAIKRRLSHYEFVNVMLCGLWLESLFLQRFAGCLNPSLARGEYEYLLHEVREEAGHSLMFLKTIESSGLPLPEDAWRAPGFSSLIGRHLPLEGALFWLAAVIGEDVPDKFNRFLRQNAQRVNPAIRQILSTHIIDEARHIALARGRLEAHLRDCGPLRRAGLAYAGRVLLHQLVRIYCFPPARFYELAGLTRGWFWRRLALKSPARRAFVAQCLAPTRRILLGHGLNVGP
jgi:P-aminobenzoate N-oxygenase AurF